MHLIYRIVTVLSLSAGLTGGAFATTPTGLGIDHFTSDGQRSATGSGLSGMSDTILSEILADPANKDCKIDHVEIRRTAERQRELELGRSPLVDPRSRVVDRTIPLGHRITGSVIDSGNGVSFTISLVNEQTGEVLQSSTGGGNNFDEIESRLREALTQLVDHLCPRVHHLKASTGPHFHIEARVCGFDKPFKVSAKGAFSGVALDFKPSSNSGGTFTQSGQAFRASWKGGGPYTVNWTGDTGRFTAQDSYTAENQAGRSRNDDKMTGTVTRLAQRCKR